jgi:ABC-type branched-subunit amino acid transport system substrate-binding protein
MRLSVIPAVLLLSGCATARAQDAGVLRPEEAPTRPGETRAPETRDSGPGAQADYNAALAKYAQADRGARPALEAFLARHPDHPSAPTAASLLARLALARGDASSARNVVGPHAARGDAQASFVLGVAESRLGHGPRALELLRPFASGPPPLPGVTDEDGELLLRSALGDALAVNGDLAGALAEWDRYFRASGVRDHEKAYARGRAEDLAGRLTADAAAQVARSSQAPLARAAVAAKAAGALRARGDAEGARRLDDEGASLRRSLGFEGAPPWLGPGDPSRLGLAVPLTGRLHVLGEVTLRGAMLAIGEGTASGEAPPFQILVRDVASGDRPELRTAELVREEAVVGIVGFGDRRAIEQTARDGVPFLVLEDQAPGRQTTAFQLIHSPDARIAELVRRSLALGARSFAILGPDSAGGQRLAESFRRAVTAGGGRVVAQATYVAPTTVFTSAVAQLSRARFDALFIPEESERLELIAPALAVANIWSRPPLRRATAPSPGPRREVLFLSTAVGLSSRLVRNAGRYVQGALLSPGFFAVGADPRSASFVNRFRQLYAQDPTATDAYGFDGIRLLRAAVERGARTRADVLRLFTTESFEGVTGTIKFGPEHGRVDVPLVYTVEGDEIRPAP